MKVLFLMIAYPDVEKNTNMYTDLTSEFLKNGHDVYVAAPDKNSTKLSYEGGIKVLRIKTLPLFNISIVIKGIANILLPYQYKRALARNFGNVIFDLVVTPTPPITFLEITEYLKEKYGAKIYLILRDIFPQNAKDLGMIRSTLVFNFFRKKEKKLYRIADSIGCMSQKNIDYVSSHNPEVDITKLHLLPNWTNIDRSANSSNSIKSKFDLEGKFVAIFGGNFGIPQKIEFLIEVADKIKEKKEILFLLVGEGTQKSKIRKMIQNKNLDNVKIIDQLPREEYLDLLRECDVGLVNLSDKFTIPNIPSRTLSYWSLKIPIIAAVDKNTDYGKLLDRCEGGVWSITGDAETYIHNLLFIFNNPDKRVQMGQNGYNYLVNELNTQKAYKTIISRA